MLAHLQRLAMLAGLAAALTLFGALGGNAREATVRGAEMNNYGRIALQFDQAVKVSARVANGILMVSFSEPVTIRTERLVAELPSYVSMVRRDPCGRPSPCHRKACA